MIETEIVFKTVSRPATAIADATVKVVIAAAVDFIVTATTVAIMQL